MAKKKVMYQISRIGPETTITMTYGTASIVISFDDTEDIDTLYGNLDGILEHSNMYLQEEETVYESVKNLDDQLNALLTLEGLDED